VDSSRDSLQTGLTRKGKRPDAEFFEDLEFIDRPEEKAPEPAPEALKRVRVCGPWLVAHEGIRYLANEVAEVPESVAQNWITQKWLVSEPSDDAAPKPARRGLRKYRKLPALFIQLCPGQECR